MDINYIISEYVAAAAAEKAAKKRAENARALLLEKLAGRDSVVTDEYSVIIKKNVSTRLDTTALYKDFPDVKREYGRESVTTTVNVAALAADGTRSA